MIWTSKLCVISKIMWMRLTFAYIDRLHYDAFIVNTWFLRHLTHWGRVVHICVSKLTIIGSDNGLSPGLRQAIIWTNAGILLIGQPKKNQWNSTWKSFIFVHENSFENAVWEMAAIWCRCQCVKETLSPNIAILVYCLPLCPFLTLQAFPLNYLDLFAGYSPSKNVDMYPGPHVIWRGSWAPIIGTVDLLLIECRSEKPISDDNHVTIFVYPLPETSLFNH